ncbi:MAG: ThuA domain-containing protein [Candidatus Omnitrophota bacterium]
MSEEEKRVLLFGGGGCHDFAGICVLYHTGGTLSVEQKRGIGEWVAGGKGFVGIHSAADSFRDSPEYIAMLGGVFTGHPFIREYLVSLKDTEHPVTKSIEGYTVKDWEKWPVYEYKVQDEQYLLDYDPRVHILATTPSTRVHLCREEGRRGIARDEKLYHILPKYIK